MKQCGCGKELGKNNVKGLCASCAAKKRATAPGAREEMSRRGKLLYADPVRGAAFREKRAEALRRWHIEQKARAKPKVKKPAAPPVRIIDSIPDDRREEFELFVKKLGSRTEAHRIIMDDIATIARRKTLATQQEAGA